MNYTPKHESITGSDLTGSNGDTNRTYTLANSGSMLAQMQLIVSENIYQESQNFTFSNGIITFLGKVFDVQPITIDYLTQLTGSYTARHETITGADLTSNAYELTNENAISSQMQVIVSQNILQEGVNYTFDSTTNTITFIDTILSAQVITIDYFTGLVACCNTLDVCRISGIGVEVFAETLGAGDDAETSYDSENGNVVSGSYKLYYGDSGSNDFTDLVETTDYRIDKDKGAILLTSSGVSSINGKVLYIDYTYSPKHSDTVLDAYLSKACAEVQKITGNYWGPIKTSTEHLDGLSDNYPHTDEPFSNTYSPDPEFDLKYKGIDSITSVKFLAFNGDTNRTVEDDQILFDEDGRLILNTTIPNGKRNVEVIYKHGYEEVPDLINELCSLIGGTMAFVNISGGSYKDISTYSFPEGSVSIGMIYVNVAASLKEFKIRINEIREMFGSNYSVV